MNNPITSVDQVPRPVVAFEIGDQFDVWVGASAGGLNERGEYTLFWPHVAVTAKDKTLRLTLELGRDLKFGTPEEAIAVAKIAADTLATVKHSLGYTLGRLVINAYFNS